MLGVAALLVRPDEELLVVATRHLHRHWEARVLQMPRGLVGVLAARALAPGARRFERQ